MSRIEPASQAPRELPLTYPGRRPETSVLLLMDHEWELQPVSHRRVGEYRVCRPEAGEVQPPDPASLDEVLSSLNSPGIDDRVPVLAIGSNACGAQMRHKADAEDFPLVVPMVRAQVTGLVTCYAPYVSSLGYVPATVAPSPGASEEIFVQFLDAAQLDALDATEVGYQRALLGPDEGVTITLPSGEELPAVHVYVAEGGHLVDADAPIPLGDQAEILDFVRGRSEALSDLLGDSAAEASRRARDADAGFRSRIRAALQDAGSLAQNM